MKIEKVQSIGILDGVTTNPSLIKAAVDFNTAGSYTVKGTIQKGEEIVEVILTVTVK